MGRSPVNLIKAYLEYNTGKYRAAMEKEAAMESFLGFKEPLPDDKSLTSLKRVPWISWDEWKFVKDSIFSSQPHCIASALRRVSYQQVSTFKLN